MNRSFIYTKTLLERERGDKTMRIVGTGDIMPGGVLNGSNKAYVSDDIRRLLDLGDVRVGTLETAIGNEPCFFEEKMKRKADVIYAKDEDLKRLVELKINIVSLANNHFTDLGEIGAKHTIDMLDSLGILHCGAGCNINEANKPVVITKQGKTYAFIAFCDWREETVGWCPFATTTSFGVNPMTDEHVKETIKSLKDEYDYIIVIPHWGIEYQIAPTKEVFLMAKLMMDSGADLILGGHTHCVQPIWNTKHKSVVFSMGNFLFPDRLLITPRSTYYHDTPLNLRDLPKTDGYPRYVDGITYKIWKPIARTGMIVDALIDEKGVRCKPTYTRLTSDNYVEVGECPVAIKKNLKRYEFYLSSGHYLMALRLHSFIRSFINK